jgi:hypothetical protein
LRFTTFRSSLLISRGRQAFYQNLFDLTLMERLPFKAAGAWLTCDAMQVHLIVHPPGFPDRQHRQRRLPFGFPHR